MYVFQEGDRNTGTGLTCKDGSSFLLDKQFINAGGPARYDMGPTSPYMQAQSVCCGGCSPIENEACAGPTTPTS